MEVHTHTNTQRKKWTHYLWEFLMLFFAVFCGFLAENFREHQVEHQKEMQFIRSMADDIKLDTAALNGILLNRIRRKEMFDSLTSLLISPQRDKFISRLYYFSRHMQRLSPVIFTYNDRTIQQLKNGGNMRLIRKQAVTDAIVLYDALVRDLGITEDRENTYMLQCLPHLYRIYDGRVMDMMIDSLSAIHEPPSNVTLLPTAMAALPDFNGSLHSMKSSNIVLQNKMKSLIAEGEKLLNIMKKEYHLE